MGLSLIAGTNAKTVVVTVFKNSASPWWSTTTWDQDRLLCYLPCNLSAHTAVEMRRTWRAVGLSVLPSLLPGVESRAAVGSLDCRGMRKALISHVATHSDEKEGRIQRKAKSNGNHFPYVLMIFHFTQSTKSTLSLLYHHSRSSPRYFQSSSCTIWYHISQHPPSFSTPVTAPWNPPSSCIKPVIDQPLHSSPPCAPVIPTFPITLLTLWVICFTPLTFQQSLCHACCCPHRQDLGPSIILTPLSLVCCAQGWSVLSFKTAWTVSKESVCMASQPWVT